MDVHQEAEQLRQVPMLAKLEPSKLKLLAFTSDAIDFADKQLLCRAGEPSDCVYVILKGEVEILDEAGDGEPVALFTIGRNSLVGELAVLRNQPRSASVRARGDVHALRITNDAFVKLLTDNPAVSLDVMRQLSEKLATTHQEVAELQRRMRQLEPIID